MADPRPNPATFALGSDFIRALIEAGLVPPETQAVTIYAKRDGLVEINLEYVGLKKWNEPLLWDRLANGKKE